MATKSTRGRRPGRARRSDVLRALFACLLIATVVGLAVFETTGESTSAAKPKRTAATSPRAQSDDGLTTGSIVFVPIDGDRCHKRLIDNATWRIRDGGEVDCTAALNQDANGRPLWSVARVEVIRKGFRQR